MLLLSFALQQKATLSNYKSLSMRFITKLIPVKGRKEESARKFLCDNHILPAKDIDILLNYGLNHSGTFTKAPCVHVKAI